MRLGNSRSSFHKKFAPPSDRSAHSGRQGLGKRAIGLSIPDITYERESTALLVVDPYDDFISEGGKIWDRIRAVAEANDCVRHMLQVLTAARKAKLRVFHVPHRRYRAGDYETWKYIAPIQKAAWMRRSLRLPIRIDRRSNMSEQIDYERRRFLGMAAMSIAAAQVGRMGSARAQTGNAKPRQLSTIKPGTNTSFGSLKQIDAGVLNVGYADTGPSGGRPVILLHGWPYDIHSFVDVAPLLASTGYRVIVPHLRGYGTTRFLSNDTDRNGQPSAVAADITALMDALKIEKATIAGFDWGARTANIIAALWPERCKAMVSVSGYLIGSQAAGKTPLPPKAEFEWWYQYYFATERGRAGYDKNRHDFAKLIWQLASPKWKFDDATFDRSAASFENPDHVAVVIHNYRWRLALAEGEPKFDDLEKRLAEAPVITVPTITLEGDANGAPHQDPAAYAKKFSGKYAHRTIKGGIGHNLPQEAPQAFAQAVVDVDSF
jgi:pimeloyl-ACP methyl ester carboxylesterase